MDEKWEIIEHRDGDGETSIYVGIPDTRGVDGRDYRLGYAALHFCKVWDYQTAVHIRDMHNAQVSL